MQIEVLGVEVNKVPGKTWKAIEVSYKNDKGEIKGKKVMSFSIKEGLDLLTGATEGTKLDIEVIKEGEYWNWKKVNAGGTSKSNGKASSGYSVPSRDFETKTERAARQVLIVRQSCLSTAVALYGIGKVVPNADDVIELARRFEGFVFSQADAPQGAEASDDVQ
jgi:hypothetical protein